MPQSVNVARQFVESMVAEEYAKGVELFDAKMTSAVTDTMLAATYRQLTTSFGKPVRHSSTRLARSTSGQAQIVYLTWEFERERVDFRVVVSSADTISGLSFETPVTR